MIFALCAIPLAMMVGMAADYANATRIKLALQDSTDAAALSLARQAPTITDAQIVPTALSYIKSSFNDTTTVTITNATVDRTTITAVVDARVSVPTTFSQLVGISSMSVTSHAVAKGMLLEIAMVLDNSTSMYEYAGSDSKINALKDASDKFLDAMFGTDPISQRVTVGIVPFAYTVNVGTQYKTAAWMDQGTGASITGEDFSPRANPFTVWSTMTNSSWGGCVMARIPPYDVDDTAPTSGNTLYSPWFYVDEPDDTRALNAYQYPNDYIADGGGNCSGSMSGWSDVQRQRRTCKYYHVTSTGPNVNCGTKPITPLTNNRSTLDSAITAMQPNGYTNIEEGLMWGWRVLSPGAPFTEGKAYTSPNNRKVIVLMTDGENYPVAISDGRNNNKSQLGTYGFQKWGHIGTSTNDNATLKDTMDQKTLTACTNAKAQGILIYTIAFGADTSGSQALLQSCATNANYFFAPVTSADLTPTFQAIAQSINSLRISQ